MELTPPLLWEFEGTRPLTNASDDDEEHDDEDDHDTTPFNQGYENDFVVDMTKAVSDEDDDDEEEEANEDDDDEKAIYELLKGKTFMKLEDKMNLAAEMLPIPFLKNFSKIENIDLISSYQRQPLKTRCTAPEVAHRIVGICNALRSEKAANPNAKFCSVAEKFLSLHKDLETKIYDAGVVARRVAHFKASKYWSEKNSSKKQIVGNLEKVKPDSKYGKDAAYCVRCGHETVFLAKSEEQREAEQKSKDALYEEKMATYNQMTPAQKKRGKVKQAPKRVIVPVDLVCGCRSATCYGQPDGGSCYLCQRKAELGQHVDPTHGSVRCPVCDCDCQFTYPHHQSQKLRQLEAAQQKMKEKKRGSDTTTSLPRSKKILPTTSRGIDDRSLSPDAMQNSILPGIIQSAIQNTVMEGVTSTSSDDFFAKVTKNVKNSLPTGMNMYDRKALAKELGNPTAKLASGQHISSLDDLSQTKSSTGHRHRRNELSGTPSSAATALPPISTATSCSSSADNRFSSLVNQNRIYGTPIPSSNNNQFLDYKSDVMAAVMQKYSDDTTTVEKKELYGKLFVKLSGPEFDQVLQTTMHFMRKEENSMDDVIELITFSM